MDDTALQTAKREVQTLLTSRATWIGIGAAGLILGLVGPFETTKALPLIPRLAYWLFVAAVGFSLGSTVSTFVAEGLRRRIGPWPAIVIAGALAGVANFSALLLINWLVFRLGFDDRGYLISLAINVVIISVVIAGAYVSIRRHSAVQAPPSADGSDVPAAQPAPPRILERLPIDKRGPLISLSVQDHYTEVVTAQGRELVLLRLSDAMAEVGDTPGLQVHRSHWVATNAITSVRREGARAILTMAGGHEIPVSRSYIPTIREAGLLPR